MNTEMQLRREQLAREIFAELNNFVDLKHSLSTIIHKLKEYSGFEAVSIRLREDDDYPYFVYEGFPEVFIQEENSLCSLKANVSGIKRTGRQLECICGNIIEGKTDPTKGYYTAKGSYVTNSTSANTPVLKKNEQNTIIRNHCNARGYESVGLFPIKTRDENIGLIQMNDKRSGLFTEELVDFVEVLGEQVGISLENAILYEKLKLKNVDLQNTLDEIKVMQNQLMEAKRMSALADLVTGIAHEVYSPVAESVSLLDSIVVRLDKTKKDNSSLNDISDEAKQIHNTLNNVKGIVKSFRNIVLDQFHETRRLINLHEFIGDIIRLVKPGMKDKEIEFVLECNSQSEIMSFSGVLSQVFTILIQNSYIHGFKNRKGGIITINCSIVDEEFIVIRYADNGLGIRSDVRHKLFEPFFTTDRKNFTGLGLTVASNLIQNKLKGKLELDDSVTTGAAFLITIPA